MRVHMASRPGAFCFHSPLLCATRTPIKTVYICCQNSRFHIRDLHSLSAQVTSFPSAVKNIHSVMFSLSECLTQAASRNEELLDVLKATDYAPPAYAQTAPTLRTYSSNV